MASEIAPSKQFEPYDEARKRRIHEMFRSWIECDEQEAKEQRETFEFLKKSLDEDRFSTRKLFR
jgi:hypothetical protein